MFLAISRHICLTVYRSTLYPEPEVAAILLDLEALGGDVGFTLRSSLSNANSGQSVSGGGDVNGDGIDDLLIAAPGSISGSLVYVAYGKATSARASTFLTTMVPQDGFIIRSNMFDLSSNVAIASDVNGDGIDDILIGMPHPLSSGGFLGQAFLIYGKSGSTRGTVNLDNLSPNDGFRITGVSEFDDAGFSVSGAGDVNHDGIADILIGVPAADDGDSAAGETYVIFGKAGTTRANINLGTFSTSDGFRVLGDAVDDNAGRDVSFAGDVNGDGIDDFIIGAPGNDAGGIYAGQAYVIFGKAGTTRSTIDLGAFASSDGFRIRGDDDYDYAGVSVSSAGDINNDGLDDLIVGAPGAGGEIYPGAAYVIFGKAGTTRSDIDVTSLSATDGFRITGEAGYDYAGYAVSGAGDVNGDGFDDILIGAHLNDSAGNNAGAAYIIFGKAGGSRANISLSSLSSGDGVKLEGKTDNSFAGRSLCAAGDVNNDGYDDLFVANGFITQEDTGDL